MGGISTLSNLGIEVNRLCPHEIIHTLVTTRSTLPMPIPYALCRHLPFSAQASIITVGSWYRALLEREPPRPHFKQYEKERQKGPQGLPEHFLLLKKEHCPAMWAFNSLARESQMYNSGQNQVHRGPRNTNVVQACQFVLIHTKS